MYRPRNHKTPYGKKVKAKKAKPPFNSPAKLKFFLWTLNEGGKFPDDNAQFERLIEAARNKELRDGWFAALPKLPRTVVYRFESWVDGRRCIVRTAKSAFAYDQWTYAVVQKTHTWHLPTKAIKC